MAELVTPADADDIMAHHNNRNRPLIETAIKDYSASLVADEWPINGETISFDINGDIVDGQNRIEAVRRTRIAMRTLIVTGLPPEVRDTVGGARARRTRDDLAIMGVPDPNHKSGILQAAVLWDRAHGLASLGGQNVRRTGLVRLWPEYEKSVEDAAPAKKYAHGAPIDTGTASLFWWLMRRHGSDPELIEQFFSIFTDGSQLSKDYVIVRLRKFLETPRYKPSGRKISIPKKRLILYMILAWNGWLAPDPQHPVSFKVNDILSDPYPKPLRGQLA